MQTNAEESLFSAIQAAVQQGKKCIVVCLVGVPSVGKSTLLSNVDHIVGQDRRLNATATRAGVTFSVHPEPVKGRLEYPFKTFLKGGTHAAGAWQMNVLAHYHTLTAELEQHARAAEHAPLPHVAFVERSPRCSFNIFAPLQAPDMECWEFQFSHDYGKRLTEHPVWRDAVYVHVCADEDAARINRAGYDPEYVTSMASAHAREYTSDPGVIQLDRTAISLDSMPYLSVQFFGAVARAVVPAEAFSRASDSTPDTSDDDDLIYSYAEDPGAFETTAVDEIFVMEK